MDGNANGCLILFLQRTGDIIRKAYPLGLVSRPGSIRPRIFHVGVEHGKDALVLGTFGCGAYKLPSQAVVDQFRQVMNEPKFAGKFHLLVFAIMESTRKPNGLDKIPLLQ